jgi:hypothetical protein
MRLKLIVAAAVAGGLLVGVGASLSLPRPQEQSPATLTRLEHEVAVLLCSHHWGGPEGVNVTHERPAEYVACVQTYERTGRVP